MPQKNLTILIVEDNPGDYAIFQEYLEEAFGQSDIIHADTLEKGIAAVDNNPVDVILLDLTLPDGGGLDTFTAIHARAGLIPIIILTGLQDTSVALESLKIGAQDFLLKDGCTPALLQKSIQYGIERSKIFEHLKKSEEQYKYLFHSNPLPMMAFEKGSFKILMVNEAAVQYYGYNEAEFVEMSINDLYAKSTLILQPANSEDANNDLKHQKKNKEIVDVDLNFHDIIIEEKNATLAVVHDVTERNKAKQELRDSELKFRTISENFPNGAVAILDKDLTVMYIAGSEFPLKNMPSSYFENTIFTNHFDTPEKEKIEQSLLEVFQGKNAVFETKNNGLSYILSAVPLYESNGSVNKILTASQNITRQKINETEKELLIEELTQSNTDLRQFSYITSHNLRAPLSNLLGILKLIDKDSINDPITTLLIENFEECTIQLNDTVNDLINILIIKNNVNSKKERLDIRKILDKVIHSVQNNIDETNSTITIELDAAYEVEFNRTYLESVLLNLLTNAIKYRSPDRNLQLNIRSEKQPGGLKLYFADNGLGINLKRNKDRVFGLYQRFHDHADSKGLGLYIVNSQIRVMGGEINIESEENVGTTFIITFKN